MKNNKRIQVIESIVKKCIIQLHRSLMGICVMQGSSNLDACAHGAASMQSASKCKLGIRLMAIQLSIASAETYGKGAASNDSKN